MAPKRERMTCSKTNTQEENKDRKKLKASELPPAPGGVNANVWAKRRENVRLVLHNPMFNPIAKKEPLAITGSGASGHITPLSRDIVVQSLKSTNKHVCAVSMFWLDPFKCSIEQFPPNWTTI